SGLAYRFEVRRRVTPGEDARVNPRVERFHAAVEHFGKSRVLGELRDRAAVVGEEARRASSRQNLDLVSGQSPCELGEAGLVGNADQRRPDGNHILILSDCIFFRSVLRLMPSISAATDWLPAARSRTISSIGRSTFFITMS